MVPSGRVRWNSSGGGARTRRSPTLPHASGGFAGRVGIWTWTLVLVLTGCASAPPRPPAASPTPAWRELATPEDLERLRTLGEAWTTALEQARAGGYGAQVEELGALADPDAALPDPAPPPGRYRCRTIKLGSPSGLLPFVAYSWFDCEVTHTGETMRLDKLTGSQRQHGTLHRDTGDRLIFLGTLSLGLDETGEFPYGADPERDVVGVLERFAPARWRLVQPWPRFESTLDLLEIAPPDVAAM